MPDNVENEEQSAVQQHVKTVSRRRVHVTLYNKLKIVEYARSHSINETCVAFQIKPRQLTLWQEQERK